VLVFYQHLVKNINSFLFFRVTVSWPPSRCLKTLPTSFPSHPIARQASTRVLRSFPRTFATFAPSSSLAPSASWTTPSSRCRLACLASRRRSSKTISFRQPESFGSRRWRLRSGWPVPGSNNSTLNFCGLEFERKITFISLLFLFRLMNKTNY